MGCSIELKSARLRLYVPALSLDTHNEQIGLAGGHEHMGHLWPYSAILAIYGPCGYDHQPNQYARYGYPGKEQEHTNQTM